MPNDIEQYLKDSEQLLAQQGVSVASNKEYVKYLDSLRALNNKADRFYRLYEVDAEEEQRYPYRPMTGADVAEFRDLYGKVFAAAENYRRYLQNSGEINNRVSTARLELMNNVGGVIGRDYTALGNTAAVTGKTLPEVIDTARGYQIDVTNQQLGVVGANASQRIPVRFTDKNGVEKKGFFTAADYVDGNSGPQKFRQELLDQYPNENDKKIIGHLLDSSVRGRIVESTQVIPFLEDETNAGTEYSHVYDKYLRKLVPEKATTEEINDFIARHSQDRKFTTDVTDFFLKKARFAEKNDAFEMANVAPGSRIDQRNAAMSSMADLLGVPDLLAHSVGMEIKNGDTVTKGVFMEFAEGSDMNRLKPDDPLRRCDREGGRNFNSPKAFKTLADLQALDYICGNTDRHTGNMFYKFDETPDGPMLSGVVGIDNDMSFGTLNPDNSRGRMTHPKAMRVISESMANKVCSMTKDMLSLTLKNYELSEEQIEAAWQRTSNLQNEIREGLKYFRKHPNEKLVSGKLRVVPDDKWADYSLDELSQPLQNGDEAYGNVGNYFSELEGVPRVALWREEDQIADQQKEADRIARFPELVKAKNSVMAQATLLDLQDSNADPFKADEDYRQIVDQVRAIREKAVELTIPDASGNMPRLSGDDIKELKESYRALYEKAAAYTAKEPPAVKDAGWKLRQSYCENFRRIARDDYGALFTAKPGQRLDAVLLGAGTRAVDVTGKELGAVGNMLSSRIPMTVSGEDGRPVKGFFTRRIERDVERESKRALQSISRQYPAKYVEKAKTAITAAGDMGLSERRRKETISGILASVKDTGARKMIKEATDYIDKVRSAKENYMGMIGDTSNAPVDTRNVAMSRVAEMCGCGDLLAKSVPMKMVDGDRKIDGTFMYNAHGSDIDHLKPGDPMVNIKADCIDHSPALKQLADMAVVDFLCNNVDRHKANIFYQIDNADPENPKITGVTGIDNDMSFGGILNGGASQSINTSGLVGITHISASMADRIRHMTPESLQLALDGSGLGKDNLDMTVNRLNMLKDKLDKAPENGGFTVVPDEEFTNYTLEDLKAKNGKINIFTCVDEGIHNIINKEIGIEQPNAENAAKKKETLDMTAAFDRNSLVQDIAPLREIGEELALADKWLIGGSSKYEDVRKATKALTGLLSKYKEQGTVVSKQDEEKVFKAYDKAKTACEAYLKHKRDDGHINDPIETKSGRRIAAAQKLLGYCKNRTETLEQAIRANELMSASRTQEEEMREAFFDGLSPEELGAYIKGLNQTAQSRNNDLSAVSKAGSQISAAGLYAQKKGLTANDLHLGQDDIAAAKANIKAGRKASVELQKQKVRRNNGPQNAPKKPAKKKLHPNITKKAIMSEKL